MIATEEIEGLFKRQLDKMQNQNLREKVVKTWVLAAERGHWESVDALRRMPFTLLTETHGVNFIEHTIAVTEGAVALGRIQSETYSNLPYSINFDYLYAGGLLHDVGKLVEIESDGRGGFRRSFSGKITGHAIFGAILGMETGLPERVINIIVCHSKRCEGYPKVIEAVLVHQADFATFDPFVLKQEGLLIE
jgi:putative nucleotidyltransferase with HDIG domain